MNAIVPHLTLFRKSISALRGGRDICRQGLNKSDGGHVLFTVVGFTTLSTGWLAVLWMAVGMEMVIHSQQADVERAYWLARGEMDSVVQQFKLDGPSVLDEDVPTPAGQVHVLTQNESGRDHGDQNPNEWKIFIIARVGGAQDVETVAYDAAQKRIVDWLDESPPPEY